MTSSFKKFYLVEEREYDRLSRPLAIKSELNWKRPIEIRAKNEDSRSMKSILTDETLPDDLKSKSYNQSLTRFINMKTSLEPQSIGEKSTEQQQQPVQQQHSAVKKKQKKKKKKKIIIRHSPIRLRKNIKKRKFDDTIWTEF